jgi:hypothetical protein
VDTIAYLFDGTPEGADLVNGPGLAGLELAALQGGGIDIEPANVTEDPEEALRVLAEMGDDPTVAAAVVAPWTAPPSGAVETLAEAGVPVVSLSWAWGFDPGRPSLTLSIAAPTRVEARMLLEAADGSPICLAGDVHPTSRPLLEEVESRAASRGRPDVRSAGIVDVRRPATVEAVAGRIGSSGCATLLWTGGPEAVAALRDLLADLPTVVGTSRIKTEAGLALAESGISVRTVCACADVALSHERKLRRFVHDFQAESGSAPGVFAVEAYDVGRMLIERIRAGEGTREDLAARLAGLRPFRGLVGRYTRRPGPALAFSGAPPGVWRAEGSRWLIERTGTA